MATQDLSNKICRTAGCPQFGDWAIRNKFNLKWGKHKRGDIVLFDFNHNGTSDHIGIVTKATSSYIETIEGNTGNGSNTNGDGVYKRKRYKSQVNYFVRPNLTDSQKELIIKTAESQLGYKEGKNNNNKYGKWYGNNNVSWCCIFIVWVFAHCKKPSTSSVYIGSFPDFTLHTREVIAQTAKDCAWKNGTKESQYKYTTGKPYGGFNKAIKEVYPSRDKWSDRPKKGASCDVFVGTILRYSGIAKKYPRGLDEQFGYKPDKMKYVKVYQKKDFQIGDVLRYTRKGGGGHTLIIVKDSKGDKRKCEANYGTKGKSYAKYGHYTDLLKSYNKDSFKRYEVLRANKPIKNFLDVGDSGTQVKRLQKFLNWYGSYNLVVDGDFGNATGKAVSSFKTKNGLGSSTRFGPKSLSKAKTVKK